MTSSGAEPTAVADWHLQPLLGQALGAEAARRALADMSAMMTREQYGWILASVRL